MAAVQTTSNPSTNKSNDQQNKRLTDQDRADLKIIDNALDALFDRKVFASRDPYILTIPQDEQAVYKHRSAFQAAQFAYHTPFGRDEWENMQYQTYHYQDPGHSLYKQQVHDYSGNSKPAPQIASAGPKKRMSLGAYTKAKIGISSPIYTPPDSERKITAKMDPKERMLRTNEDMVAAVKKADEQYKLDRDAREAKRKSEVAAAPMDNEHKAGSKVLERSQDEARPIKKARHDDGNEIDGETNTEPNKLPPKLSPLRNTITPLPPRLSPNLPYNIDAALRDQRNAADKRQEKLATSQTSKHISPVPKNGFRTDSRSPGETPASNTKDKTLMVKLKVEAGKKKQDKQDSESHVEDVTQSKTGRETLSKVDSHSPKSGLTKTSTESKKRTRDEEPTGSAKKLKSADGRPITPAQPELLSPESIKTTSSLHKGAQHTTMQRVQSSDGMSKTPVPAETPQGNSHEHKTPSKTAAAKTAAQRAWEAERNKYDALGRSLKHASRDHGNEKPPADEMMAVKALESMICYLIAFTCSDEASASAEPKGPPSLSTWMGLTAWYNGVKRNCSGIPELHGMASMLGLALSSRVLGLLAWRGTHEQSTYNEYIHLLISSSSDMTSKLHLGIIQESYKASWEKSQYAPPALKHDSQELLTTQYQLPVGMQTTPLQAALAARAMLAEWLEKSKYDYKLQV